MSEIERNCKFYEQSIKRLCVLFNEQKSKGYGTFQLGEDSKWVSEYVATIVQANYFCYDATQSRTKKNDRSFSKTWHGICNHYARQASRVELSSTYSIYAIDGQHMWPKGEIKSELQHDKPGLAQPLTWWMIKEF